MNKIIEKAEEKNIDYSPSNKDVYNKMKTFYESITNNNNDVK